MVPMMKDRTMKQLVILISSLLLSACGSNLQALSSDAIGCSPALIAISDRDTKDVGTEDEHTKTVPVWTATASCEKAPVEYWCELVPADPSRKTPESADCQREGKYDCSNKRHRDPRCGL